MSERREVETTDAHRSRRAFLAHMRHELRTPLNGIIGYSEILLEDALEGGQEQLIPDLERIRGAGKQLLALVNDLLDPVKIQAALAELDMERFSARLHHELRTPLNHVLGYSELLLDDAADAGQERFVPELKNIQAAAQKLGELIADIVRLSKIDTGEADLDVASVAISPIVQEAVTTIRPVEAGATGARPVDHASVLVVDDSESNRDLLSRRLARQGYRVWIAENGRQALEMLQAQRDDPRRPAFDLVLLDVLMPGLNGYQVLQQLKSDPALCHLPVIMISALDEIDSVVRCIELGAEDFLPKPFNPVLLQARVGASLEKKRLRDREVLYLQQIEAERQRSDELLHVIFPPQVVTELKETNTVQPRLYENVAILFCDVVGFTPYCEQQPAEEVLRALQEQTELYEALTLRHRMQKIKTIGDDFMATAGLLEPVEDPVLTCVRCGLDMIAASARLPARWTVRVGVHVGPVVAGVVGHRQYMFDIFGDTVNTAKRVESHGADGWVNVSERAWEQVADVCLGRSLGLIAVKGKGEMKLYRIDGLRSEAPGH